MSTPSPDAPISKPADDLYGIEPFARAMAKAVADMKAPDGIVIGVNGVWGSGKTSALGLVRHHLGAHVKNDELVIIDFSPWWFASQEALTRAYFEELGAKIERSLGDTVKGTFRAIGRRISGFGESVGAAADAASGIPGAGAAVKSAVSVVGGLLGAEDTVVEAQERLAQQLGAQKKRFLVVIDDIDRLSPEDALALFRLVKSVGRMPNVIYLLAFDRNLAEKVVKERYPAEGAHYLEKIVQAWFDLPAPTTFDLRQVFLTRAHEIVGGVENPVEGVRVMNAFYGIVARHLKTPRDVVRLLNVLRVSYSSVSGEVDVADFLGIEAIRLFHPGLHAVIARHGKVLCGTLRSEHERGEQRRARFDALLLAGISDDAKADMRDALGRLFPGLESVWDGHGYGDGFEEQWRSERRICSEAHFASYFRFALSEETVSAKELAEVINAAGDEKAVQDALRAALKVGRRTGGTRAALLLEELTVNAKRIGAENIPNFVKAMFAIADELDVEADEAPPFEIGSNGLRLHWLMNKLLIGRLELKERSRIIGEAAKGANLGWLVDVAERCAEQKKKERADGDRLVDDETTGAVVKLAVDGLKAAAADGNLARRDDVCTLLHSWKRLSADGLAAGRQFAGRYLEDDAFVVRLAKAAIGTSGVHSSGDLVARRERSVRLEAIEAFVDADVFTARAEHVLGTAHLDEAWRRILSDFRELPRENRRMGPKADSE